MRRQNDRSRQRLLKNPNDAYAFHHLGLISERMGEMADAERYFTKARNLSPMEFSKPWLVDDKEFDAEVERAISELDDSTQEKLKAVQLEIIDLPKLDDLKAVAPPFAPTILGLYRGFH